MISCYQISDLKNKGPEVYFWGINNLGMIKSSISMAYVAYLFDWLTAGPPQNQWLDIGEPMIIILDDLSSGNRLSNLLKCLKHPPKADQISCGVPCGLAAIGYGLHALHSIMIMPWLYLGQSPGILFSSWFKILPIGLLTGCSILTCAHTKQAVASNLIVIVIY